MSENKSMLKKQPQSFSVASSEQNKIKENEKIEQKKDLYVVPAIFTVIAVTCYVLSLTGCEGTQAECLRDFDQTKIKYFVLAMLVSAFCFTSNYTILIYSRRNFHVVAFQTIVLLYLCFVHDTGSTLKKHGAYNRIFLALLMLIFFVIFNFIMLFYIIMRRRIILTVILLAILLGTSYLIVNYKLEASCGNWDKGLGDVRIDNDTNYCPIKTPKKCWMNLMSGVFDISGFFGEDCTQIRMDSKDQLARWTKVTNAKILGFPRVEKYRFYPECTLDEFQYRVLANMIDMEDPKISEAVKAKTEAIIDFRKQPAELTVKAARDDDLAENRNKVYESKKENLMAKNVIHFFIDSLSRDNFRRKLPKTRTFFEKYYKKDIGNNMEDENEAQVFQFLKYHGLASWTLANMVPVFFGVDFTFKKGPSPVNYNKYFKEAGYISGQGHGYCGRDILDIEPGNLEKFVWAPFDHEINPIFCDPNFSVPGHPYAILNGTFSMKRRCLYGKDTHSYIFDYAKSFWEAYPNEPKFFRLAFQDAHEGTGEVVQYMDDKIIAFFEFLEQKGSLKDTIVVFHSDHGVNMPGFYTFVDAEDFQIEKSLPTFLIMLPKDLAKKHEKELKAKENIMITPYDLHNTFLHIVNAPPESRNNLGGSLFEHIDPKKRDCDKFNVRDPFCNCLGERDNYEWDY